MSKRSAGSANFDAQQKLADKLRKTKKIKAKQLPMQRDTSDVPMSSEMVNWLASTLEPDDDGHLPETVSSVLAPPMDAMGLYTPVGALSVSQYAAIKPEESVNEKEKRRRTEQRMSDSLADELSMSEASFQSVTAASSIGGETADTGMMSVSTTWSLNKAKEDRPKSMLKSEALERLEVLWMQQRAKIEAKEGNHAKAFNTLKSALDLQLGPSTEYKDANLGDHTFNDGEMLYAHVAQEYRDFDKTAHFDASRIQRCYLRWNRWRSEKARVLQRLYRGFQVRLASFEARQRQLQTVQIIQRRFRKYLHILFTNSDFIKFWYRKLKLMEDFKTQLFWYRKAYRIQRLYRGYGGRQVAYQKRQELLSTNLIQRLSRSWRIRHQRSQAIRQIHHKYHRAAVVIQGRIRQVLSIRHSQIQLLREFSREGDRMDREEAIVAEAVNVSLKKTQLYMQTEAGYIHKEVVKHRINLKDKLFKKNIGTLSEADILAQEALVSFELFDRDGSGRIDEDELADMLVQLAIPADEETVKKLAKEIDTDGGGDIDFGEFLEWYTGGGSADVEANASFEDQLFKQLLRARTYVLEVSGFILQRRAERDILRQCTSWLSKDTAATFRISHHPKFECCHCMEPFVMFADYEDHYDVNGHCKVCDQKAIYYPNYWTKGDWGKQRQVEFELRRLNDEVPNVNYHCVMASFLEMSLQRDAGVAGLLHDKTKKAQIIYMEKRGEGPGQGQEAGSGGGGGGDDGEGGDGAPAAATVSRGGGGGDGVSMSEEVMDVVNICGDGHLSPLVAMCVAGCLGAKIPDEWVTEDSWDIERFREWVTEVVDGENGISKRRPKVPSCNEEQEVLKAQTWLLAEVYVRVVRLLQVAAESSLIALLDFRSRRPRVISLPDQELERVGLSHLTTAAYHKSRDVVLGRLNVCNAALERLSVINVPGCCESMLRRAPGGKVQVGPDGKLSKEDMQRLLVSDAHIMSLAKYKARLRSKIGSTQLHRLASELFASHVTLRRGGCVEAAAALTDNEVKVPGGSKWDAGDAVFLYHLLANEATGDGIDLWDLDLLERNLNMTVKAAKMPSFRKDVDPQDTGYVAPQRFLPWVLGKKHKDYFSLTKGASMAVAWPIMATFSSWYYVHAEDKLLSNIRIVSRLEMDYRAKSIEALLLSSQLAVSEDALGDEAAKAKALEGYDAEGMAPITSSEELIEAGKTPEQREKEKAQREAAAQKQRLDMDKEKERLRELREAAEILAHKMTLMKHADDEGESLLLYRMEMAEARERCIESFATTKGLRDLLTEQMLIENTQVMIQAMGYTIASGARYPWTATLIGGGNTGGGDKGQGAGKGKGKSKSKSEEAEGQYETGWALALQQLIYAFDTDCSGGFDEGEVSLLLSCANCGLSERQVLLQFPEVVGDSAVVEVLSHYLAPRVLWGRGLLTRLGWKGGTHLYLKPNIVSAASMLISLSMQRARAAAEEATALTRTGELLEEEDEKNEEAIMTRAQMFAMRQVQLFLGTVQGRQKLRLTKKGVKYWWKEDVWRTGGSREGLFNYAFMVHKDHRGVLITELPHLIRFLVKYMGFTTTPEVREVATMVYEVKSKDKVRWLGQTEVMQVLDRAISHNSLPFRAKLSTAAIVGRLYNVRRDAILNLTSRARQQSVLVSLRFEGIFVADTNYRCSVLGLRDVMKEISANSTWGILKSKPKMESKIDWRQVPREAMHFLLLSHGYSLDDMNINEVGDWVEIEHKSGGIATDVVCVPDALAAVKKETSKAFTGYTGYLQKARRWGNYITNATGGVVAYWHYFRIAKALSAEGKKVNVEGAKYLREILTGQSHCVAEGE